MKTNAIAAYFLWILCLAGAVCPPAHADDSPQITFKQDELTIKTAASDYRFTIEIAETPAQLELGLMHRKTLAGTHGMLFIMPEDRPVSMWMKNTLIPLDMLFIDGHGQIVYIAPQATPESTAIITAGRSVRAVLELAGGTAALRGIHVGDRVAHAYFKP